ncbi:MAG: hypothetical protein V3V01_10350 [Acidimicrobiales bacterium]
MTQPEVIASDDGFGSPPHNRHTLAGAVTPRVRRFVSLDGVSQPPVNDWDEMHRSAYQRRGRLVAVGLIAVALVIFAGVALAIIIAS